MIWQENTDRFLSFKSWKTTNCALYLIFVIGVDPYKHFVVFTLIGMSYGSKKNAYL